MKAELLIDAKTMLGEGPSWDREAGRLIWVDIWGLCVHLFDPSTGEDKPVPVGQQVGAAVPGPDGTLVVAMKGGFYTLFPNTGELQPIADPEKGIVNNRFNDGKCDPAGRFWAGTMSMKEGIERETGSLYCLEPDYSVRTVIRNVTTSNGIAWSPDYKIMYYIDSPTRRVDAFDFDLSEGTLSGRRPVLTIPEGGGFPDGMTSDEEGNLWVAQWGGYQVSRWNPATGEMLEVIPIPAPHVTSCVFGGKDMDELYITTARKDMTAEQLAAYPLSGGLFRVKTNAKGMPTHRFGAFAQYFPGERTK